MRGACEAMTSLYCTYVCAFPLLVCLRARLSLDSHLRSRTVTASSVLPLLRSATGMRLLGSVFALLLCLLSLSLSPLLVFSRPIPSHCSLLSPSAAPLPSPYLSPSASRGCPVPRSSPSHPLNGRVSLPFLSTFDDCALRAFTVEMAAYTAPPAARSNWTALASSALQMDRCPPRPFEPPGSLPVPGPPAPSPCALQVWVDAGAAGGGNGSRDAPIASLHAALAVVRALRVNGYPAPARLCVVIRAGVYYLGANATSHSSRVGAVSLVSTDSHLTLRAAAGEEVVLSGGALLSPVWEPHSSLPAGVVYRAKLEPTVDLDAFNELYVDGRRAVRAKYPNGDPATHLWTADARSGYVDDSDGWWWDPVRPSVDVSAAPVKNASAFGTHQWGLLGDADVFEPPRNFWATAHPPHGSTYIRPSMFTSNLTRMANWTDPAAQGQVMLFHQFYWGSWMFDIRGVSPHNRSLLLGDGGWQEARGLNWGSAYYVHGLYEELDDPMEWWVDRSEGYLYFMANATEQPDPGRLTFVAAQVPCILSITGSEAQQVVGVTVSGLTFAETSHTFMQRYEAPSGGDWSVHRGGAVFLSQTEDVALEQSLFTQLGSNAVALSGYNLRSRVERNEFAWLGDSGVVLLGRTEGIDGLRNDQPTLSLIRGNLFRETGIYIKQSSPVLISLSRSATVDANVMFNMPRAAINVNDGFYGNHTLSRNVLFNAVRETSDHGPINTWDRQPYLTTGADGVTASLQQHTSFIHHNAILNNYNSFYPIDHDDGSSHWEDSFNVQIGGGKKSYLGNSKTDHDELYVYPDLNTQQGTGVCIAYQDDRTPFPGYDEVWVHNRCALLASPRVYTISYCNTSDLLIPLLANNTIYAPSGKETDAVFVCNDAKGAEVRMNLTQWQALGVDLGTSVQPAPSLQQLIQWGRDMLQANDEEEHSQRVTREE